MLLRRIIPITLLVHLFRVFLTNGLVIPATYIVGFRRRYFAWLSVFVLLLHAHTGQAQFDPTTQQSAAEIDSSRGYWRLKTQAATRSTLIQFFGPAKELLYEEIIPGKWVKLSRKNQKQFDQLLDQLLAKQLLTNRIETETLPPTPVEPTPPRLSVRSNSSHESPSATASYLVHAYVNSTGKLYLIVDNPERLRYSVKVVDQIGNALYEEFTNRDQYRRRLDISALPHDAYQVVVQIDNKPFTYKVKRQENKMAYTIQPLSIPNPQAIVEQNRQDSKPLLIPVTIDL
ncbi:hypothetical protein GO755_03550 [Spirosoma sp. HMF4905]|uniref:Uncharacterized protein n=1 Tax=Spirosoma arboris TaxID=2682092 RepID=A0A7K1S5M6_9BACT|nr:hypothetical protein [Spirosoma arboris]MVM29094.1 hypothetical protein [Spirosoma arboris]